MTLADTPASQRKSLPSFVRRLAIALVVALVAAAAICVCHLTHRPVGYSGNARISSFISPDFASGFDVAWEMTASELGVSGQLYSHAKVDDTLVAIFRDKDQPPPPRSSPSTCAARSPRSCGAASWPNRARRS